MLSHFWTLAVEQQFYLFWPFLLLFVAPSCALVVIIALLVDSPLLRAWEIIALAPFQPPITSILLPMCADYLAWGALLAFTRRSARVPHVVNRHGSVAALGLLGPIWAARSLPADSSARIAVDVGLFGFASALLVAHCIGPHDSSLRRLIRLRPFVYLGTISYGIYVIHNFCHRIGPSLLRRFTGENYFRSELLHVAWFTGLSILLAALGRHFFEQPVARLGRRVLCAEGGASS